MKKIIYLLPIFLITNLVSAQSFGEIGTESINSFYQRMLQTTDTSWRTTQVNKVITELQKLLPNNITQSTTDGSTNTCRKLTQTLW